jgi:hypothetical protein
MSMGTGFTLRYHQVCTHKTTSGCSLREALEVIHMRVDPSKSGIIVFLR